MRFNSSDAHRGGPLSATSLSLTRPRRRPCRASRPTTGVLSLKNIACPGNHVFCTLARILPVRAHGRRVRSLPRPGRRPDRQDVGQISHQDVVQDGKPLVVLDEVQDAACQLSASATEDGGRRSPSRRRCRGRRSPRRARSCHQRAVRSAGRRYFLLGAGRLSPLVPGPSVRRAARLEARAGPKVALHSRRRPLLLACNKPEPPRRTPGTASPSRFVTERLRALLLSFSCRPCRSCFLSAPPSSGLRDGSSRATDGICSSAWGVGGNFWPNALQRASAFTADLRACAM